MPLDIACESCGYSFACSRYNSRIKGPIINVKCPKCGHTVRQNMSAFVARPFDDESLCSLVKARSMIDLAQEITLEVGEDTAFTKRKK